MSDYDEGEHVKETFAYFGRAYYMANVFEAGLAIALMQLDFLAEVARNFIASGRKPIDKNAYDKDFDKFMNDQHRMTLGNLIRSASRFSELSEEFRSELIEVKKQRDFIAHHFFRERSAEFTSRRGRDSMIAELDAANEMFIRADRALDKLMEPVRHRLGFDEEKLEALQKKFMEEARKDDQD